MESLTRLVTNSLRNPGGVTKLWSFSLADPSQGRREKLHKVRRLYWVARAWLKERTRGGSDEGEGKEGTCGSPKLWDRKSPFALTVGMNQTLITQPSPQSLSPTAPPPPQQIVGDPLRRLGWDRSARHERSDFST